MTPSLVYKAEVKVGSENKMYIGQTTNTFRNRLALHNSDVRTEKNRTGLTTYLIGKKKKGINVDEIKWSKMFEVHPRQKGEKMCNLCNLEKTSIAIADPSISLNKRSEILQRCRHRDKLVLANNLSRHRR